MADEKIYYPQTIIDSPLPGQEVEVPTSSQAGANEVYVPKTTPDRAFPVKRVAAELIGAALNTKSRKILGEFEFTKQGAIQIGKQEDGVSGDVRISPSGITARDSAGNTTFALDGDTGDAVFKGTVQAADFVIADENGLVSASVFQSDSYRANDTVTLTGTNAFTDVAGSSLAFTLVRPAKILITFFANVTLYATDTLRSYHIDVGAGIDGAISNNDYARFEVNRMNSDLGTCLSFAKTYLFDAGSHTINLKWATFSDVSGTNELKSRGLDYCMLGS